jgi:transposase
MLWIGVVLLPEDGLRKVPTTALCSFVNQLNTARRFMWNKATRAKCSVEQHHNLTVGGFIMVVSVGIDVSKDKHDCFILNSEGEVLADVFTIPNNMDGFTCLLQKIRDCTTSQDKIRVGLEATGHYSYNILGFLLDNGLATYVLNPLRTNLYRKSLSLRKTKTDRVDARTIAAMLLSDVGLKPYTDTAYHNEELKSLTRYRFDKVKERAKLKCSVSRLVCILFPELENLVPSLHGASVYALLEEFPGAVQIAGAHLTRLKSLLTDASRGRYGRDMALDIRDAARNSIGSRMPAKSLELQHTIRLIRELDAEIEEIETEIQAMMDELHSPITTIPGIGCRMGAMILAEVGDFSRFESPDKLLAYAGLSPSTYQSGQLKNCYPHMEKRGSRYLRYAIYNATKYVCLWDPAFASYLAKKRAEGKHYNVAISHAAKKLVRLIFALEKSRQPYRLVA